MSSSRKSPPPVSSTLNGVQAGVALLGSFASHASTGHVIPRVEDSIAALPGKIGAGLACGALWVVGQTLRYMSYVLEELAEAGQTALGAITAHEDDQRIRRA